MKQLEEVAEVRFTTQEHHWQLVDAGQEVVLLHRVVVHLAHARQTQ